MNDSLEAMRMAQMLVDIVLLLYIPEDRVAIAVEGDIPPPKAGFADVPINDLSDLNRTD